MGPFRIKKVEGREIYIVWNENEFRVEVSQAKPWEGGESLETSPPEEEDVPSNIMTSEEMAAEGIYLVDQVLDYKKDGQKYLFLVQWQGYQEATWEPIENFVYFSHRTKAMKVNEVFEKYVETLDVRSEVYAECKRKLHQLRWGCQDRQVRNQADHASSSN